MMITDHINFQPGNPLVGPNDESLGPRFVGLENAYDLGLQDVMQRAADAHDVTLHRGVYLSTLGPSFETPAEIRAYRILGGDVIGMSTVPEVLVARHCGLRVATVSVITNFAAGMSDESITHDGTLHFGKLGAEKLSRLLIATIESLNHDPC